MKRIVLFLVTNVAVMLVLSLCWEVGARRTAGISGPWRATLRRTAMPLLVVPAVRPGTEITASALAGTTSQGIEPLSKAPDHAACAAPTDCFYSSTPCAGAGGTQRDVR